MRHSSRPAFLCLICIGAILFLAPTVFNRTTNAAPPEQRLVWLHAKTPEQIQQWVDNGLDVWQVEGERVLAQVTQEQVAGLEFDLGPNLDTPGFPACYRTYSDLIVFFHEMQARYPHLFRLYDAGDSWETEQGLVNRNIYVVRLTNHDIRTAKPKLFLTAEHHAREIITPEIALMFIEDLLQNYDQDPQIRWLLDNREVWVMPMANPDGHARVAELANWRKNTDRPQLCPNGQPPNSYGVDLNRNYGYQWGLNIGSSPDPCNLTYRGSEPFSEPETRAVRDLVRQQHFDMLLSLHAYGDEILYPWGYTSQPAPDAENLHRIAYRMAQEAGYEAMQSFSIGYMSSGDTTDWAYGELGIPAFTFEVGGMEDGFFWPACAKRQELYTEIRNTLVYAATITDDPYERANGPDIRQFALELDTQMVINVLADDMWNGGDAIAQIELFFDTLGEPGTGIPAVPTDGEFNTVRERGIFRLDSSDVPPDTALVFLRAQDVKGHWGPPRVAALRWPPDERPTPTPTTTMPAPVMTPTSTPTLPSLELTPIPPRTTPIPFSSPTPPLPSPTAVPPPSPTPTMSNLWRPADRIYLPLVCTD